MSDVDKMHRCPDCGKPMTLAPGIDYFCETPACSEKMFEEFAKGVRNYAVRREHAPKARTDPTGKDATIEFLTRQLEEARGRIGERNDALERIDGIAKATLSRGDFEYGIGQILSVVQEVTRKT